MVDTSETREERLGRLRGWARPPFRTLEVALPAGQSQSSSHGGGITVLPAGGVKPEDLPGVPGSPTTFHTSCDAPAGTTVSEGGGPFLNQPKVLCAFWGAIWNTGITPSASAIYAAVSQLSTPVSNEYGAYGYFDGLGSGWSFDPSEPPIVVTSSSVTIPQTFTASDIEQATRAIVATLGPKLSWDLLVIFLPPGYSAVGAAGAHSFYWDAGEPSVEFAWINYSTQLANITYTVSHEMTEAMTDPHGDGTQVNPRNSTSWNEICDVCCSSGTYNGVVVSAYFSQAVGACMLRSPPTPLLPSADYLIDMVRKVYDHAKGERLRYVQSVSGPGNGGGRWSLAEADVVAMIQEGKATFHTLVDGQRANVMVQEWFLQTVADGFAANNLEALPEY